METALIGLDLGTTTCKSVVFDQDLKILGEAYVEYPLIHLSPVEIEQDAELWWELTRQVIRDSVRKAGIPSDAIKAIGVSAQGISFVPVDENCRPIRNAINWLDKRARKQSEKILSMMSQEKLFQILGTKTGDGSVLAKLLWFVENEPELYGKTYKILTAHDFITAKLCGSMATDHTMAGGLGMYDIRKRRWSEEILCMAGLDESILPGIVGSGKVVGTINGDVAAELGLSPKTMVCTGGQDQKCACFGAGIKEGIGTVSLGTAAAITQICTYPVMDDFMRIPCGAFVIEGKWVNEGVVGTAGASLQWLKNCLFPTQSYLELDQLAQEGYGKAGNLFFYPYLNGAGTPYGNRNVRGFITGINLSTSAGEIIRGTLEGTAFQIRTNLEIMQKLHKPLHEIRVFGGGSKSGLWCRMISDITNMRVTTLYTPETANVGSAILAGLGCGIFANPEDALTKIKIKQTYYPEKQISDMYEEKYKEYLKVNDKMLS